MVIRYWIQAELHDSSNPWVQYRGQRENAEELWFISFPLALSVDSLRDK